MYNTEIKTGKVCNCGGEIVQKFGGPCILAVPGEEYPMGCGSPNITSDRDNRPNDYYCKGCGICFEHLPENSPMLYSRIVVICREGFSEAIPFKAGDEKEAEKYFESVSVQWSDSYLCSVLRGPVV